MSTSTPWTYNTPKAPYHDDVNHIIIFNQQRYYIPNEVTYTSLLQALTAAVTSKDMSRIYTALNSLTQYKTNRVSGIAYRQQVTRNRHTGDIVD